MITRCAVKDFGLFEDNKAAQLYELVQFYTVKEMLKKYEAEIMYSYRDKIILMQPFTYFNSSIYQHVFHF